MQYIYLGNGEKWPYTISSKNSIPSFPLDTTNIRVNRDYRITRLNLININANLALRCICVKHYERF